MRSNLLLFIYFLPLSLFSQEVLEGRWTMELGASTNNSYRDSTSINIRLVSPRFKCSNEEWTDEMEKRPEKYKRARFMFEFMYRPPFEIFTGSMNLQYRIMKIKRLTLEAYMGFKFLFAAPPGFITNPIVAEVADKNGWYLNYGLILQLDLGVIDPFADAGYDGLITIGAEIDFHSIYKKIKKMYRPYIKEG